MLQKNASIILVVLLGISLVACVPKQKEYPLFNLGNPGVDFSKEKNLSLEISSITIGQKNKTADLIVSTEYGYSPQKLKIKSSATICDFPAFKVTLENKTNHIIRFDNYKVQGSTQIKAVDSNGKIYDSLSKAASLARMNSWAESEAEKHKRYWALGPIQRKLKTTNIIDQTQVLLPGLKTEGYLFFDFNLETMDDYVELMGSITYLDIMFFEIPVEVNKAGETIRTANYKYRFPIAQLQNQ